MFEELFDYISIWCPLNDLISYILLRALFIAKVASLHQFTKGDQETIKAFAGPLCTAMEVASFHRLIHLAINVALNLVIMASTSCFCSAVRLRLFTMARVSLDRHRVNTCTLVSADSPLNLDRVV